MANRYIHMILRTARKFSKDQSGASAIEYVVIATLISIALVVGAKNIGGFVDNSFSCTAESVQSGTQTGDCDTSQDGNGEAAPDTGGVTPNTGGVKPYKPNTGGVKQPPGIKVRPLQPTKPMKPVQPPVTPVKPMAPVKPATKSVQRKSAP